MKKVKLNIIALFMVLLFTVVMVFAGNVNTVTAYAETEEETVTEILPTEGTEEIVEEPTDDISEKIIEYLKDKYGVDYEEISNLLMEKYEGTIYAYLQQLVEEQKLTQEEADGWDMLFKVSIMVIAVGAILTAVIYSFLKKKKERDTINQFKYGINQILIASNALIESEKAGSDALKKILSVKGKDEADKLASTDEGLAKAQEEIKKDV